MSRALSWLLSSLPAGASELLVADWHRDSLDCETNRP